jgi:hypothetical protein
VAVVIRVVVGLVLLAHGLVHLLYFVPEADKPGYPFTLRSSWFVPEAARRPVAWVLAGGTVVAFALLALAVWGVPGLAAGWPVLAVLAGALSLGLLVAFWNVRLLAGVAISVVVIGLAVIRPEWTDRLGG